METVSFFTFLEEKITEILFQLFFLALVAFLLIFYGVDMLFVVYVCEIASHGDCTPRPFQKKASDPRSDPRATVGKVVLP